MRFVILFLSFCMFSCGSKLGKTENPEKPLKGDVEVERTGTDTDFPLPEVPLMITSSGEVKSYMVAHFWDVFSFKDSVLLGNREVLASGLSRFFAFSSESVPEGQNSGESVRKGFQTLCKGITENPGLTDSLKYYVEEFLYNPNSPYYNEELYGVYLKEMIAALPDDNPMVSAYNFKLKLISRNCVGNKAENFYYFLPDGTKRSLYVTDTKGEFTVLAFYDPECHSCHDIMMGMFADREMHDVVNRGLVTVMAIYVNGDTEVWKKYLNGMPRNWIVGDDRRTIIENSLYDLKAMPTLYLLDKERKVVLKDAPYDVIRKKVLGTLQ